MNQQVRVVFDAELTNLAAIRDFVGRTAKALGMAQEAVDGMVQAVDEAATNTIVHGYRGGPGSIEIEMSADENALVTRLRDQAPAFDPTSVPAPRLDTSLQLRRPGGLGVHLMRRFADRMTYRRTETGQNELTLKIDRH